MRAFSLSIKYFVEVEGLTIGRFEVILAFSFFRAFLRVFKIVVGLLNLCVCFLPYIALHQLNSLGGRFVQVN
jgi:hypothetical protein